MKKLPVAFRKSDDALQYRCKTDDRRDATGSMPSEMGGKIIASAVVIDFGITDAVTGKHRRYASSNVIPMPKRTEPAPTAVTTGL